MTVPFDYDTQPERYRLGNRLRHEHTRGDLYAHIAGQLTGTDHVLDIGCAEGVLRAALPDDGPWLVGVDASITMLRAHPRPAVLADATALPFPDNTFDAVTAVNMLYHLTDPLIALREAHRVLRPGGRLIAATIARADSPELAAYWVRQPTTFDAEDAPGIVAAVFTDVTVHAWDAPLVTLPTPESIRDYLVARMVSRDVAEKAARELSVPFPVTKRGALVVGRRS